MTQVGGLTAAVDNSNHYELRKKQAVQSSRLIVDGSMLVTSSDLGPTNVSIEVVVRLPGRGSLVLDGPTSMLLFSSLDMYPDSSLSVSSMATLLLSGPDSSLQMASGAHLFGSVGTTGSATIAFSGGSHHINSSIMNGSLSVGLTKYARLHLSSFNSSLNANDTYGFIGLKSLVVSGGAVLTMTSMRGNVLSSSSIHLLDGGQLVTNNLTIVVDDVLHIDHSSSISADGGGYEIGDGPAAGKSYKLGGTGGAHGGYGGNSKVHSSGIPYDPYWVPSRPGSGGGLGFSRDSSSGGFGGGVLFISVTGQLIVNGIISSNGNAGVLASGGGAGGTVFITTRRLLGSGMISCRGGDGGFSGGTASGGGGSGGRVALHLDELLFDGQFDVTGGYRKPTYDVPNVKQAGPGTVFITVKKDEILALVTGSHMFGNYTNNLKSRSPLTPSQFVESVVASSSAGSSIQLTTGTDNIQFPKGYKCNVDLHVIGGAPLIISGGEFCVNKLVGSGRGATVQASDYVGLSYKGPSLNLQTIRLALYDVSFAVDPIIEVSNEGSMSLHRNDWTFDHLSVMAGGSLVAYSGNVTISADRISLQSGSTVSLSGDLTLQSHSIDVTSSSFGRNVESNKFSGIDCANLVISDLSIMDMSGNVSVASTNIYVRGALTVQKSLSVLKHSHADESTVMLAKTGSIVVSPSATLLSESMLHLEGSILLGNSSALRLQSGAMCGTTGTLSIPSGATLHLQNGSFLMQDGCSIAGQGRILLNGIFLPSADLPASTPPIYVASYGELRPRSNDATANASFVIRTELYIEEGGRLFVSNDTTVSVNHLSITGGSIVLSSNYSILLLAFDSSRLSNTDAFSFHDGFVLGRGSLLVSESSVLKLCPWGSVTVLEATLVNHGTIEASDGTVYFGRGAAVINDADIVFVGDQRWLHREDLYGYNDPLSCSDSFGLMDNAGTALYSLAVEECATRCTHQLIEQTREQAVRYLATEFVQCQAFVYNDLLMTCQVLTQDGARDSQKTCTATPTVDGRIGAWRFYRRNLQWTSPPSLYNLARGTLHALASSTASVSIELVNNGMIHSDAQGSLNISNIFHQSSMGSLKSSGVIEINAKQAHQSRKETSVSGLLTGDGLIHLQSTTASRKSGIILQPDISVNSPQLSIIISGSIRISSAYSMITLLNLDLVDAHVLVENTSTHFNISNAMRLMESSCIETASNMLIGPSGSDLFSNIAFSLPTAAPLTSLNVDVLITASQLVLIDSSKLNVANAYILADSIHVTSSSEIISTGRGFDGGVPLGNFSQLAGQFGFMGSQGGSYRGFGGAGYGVVTSSNLFSSKRSYGDVYSAHDWGAPGGRGSDGKYSPGGAR